MKKLLAFTLSLFIIVTSSLQSAANEPTNKKVSEAFTKMFASAQSVKWDQSSSLFKADFIINGAHMSAFYAEDATLIGVSRNVISYQLPLHLMTDLKKKYSEFWITELFEYATADSDSYYVTLENAEKKLILKGNMNGFIVYKKTAK